MERSASREGTEGSEPAESPINPSVFEKPLLGSNCGWFSPDLQHMLEPMPELVHGHGSNDGELDPDTEIADPVLSHHQLLNQQANLVRYLHSTHEPLLQPDEPGAGHTANSQAGLDESYIQAVDRSPKLQYTSSNRHTSWDSYLFHNQPAPGLLQQGSLSPHHPKEGAVQAQTRIMDDPFAYQSDSLHSVEENPPDAVNSLQYVSQSDPSVVSLDWSSDIALPAYQTAHWDQFSNTPDGLLGDQEVPNPENCFNSVPQDQVDIPPGPGAVGNASVLPEFQQTGPGPSVNYESPVNDNRYEEGSEQEPTFKEEPIETHFFSSPVSNGNYSAIENRHVEGDGYLRLAETSTDVTQAGLAPAAHCPPIHDIRQTESTTASTTRTRAGSAPSKKGQWRGTPNLPLLMTDPTKHARNKSEDMNEQSFRASPLQIVQEDGQGGAISGSAYRMTPATRARRVGPLSNTGRRDAALRRKHKNVCVWCRLAKKKCSGDSPCTTCLKAMILEQPCVKADFFQIVESGTCNYISQRAVNHLTLDGSTRVRMDLPGTFDMSQLLSLLDERRGRFSIRARQSWGPLYVLDMDETYKFLRDMNKGEVNAQHDLGDFIDHRILKANKWDRCVKECNPMRNLISLLSQWNNMPSRASYEFVSMVDGVPDRPMNIQNPEDQTEIILAAQLSRIFCRKLEIDGYKKLQNILSNHRWDEYSGETLTRFVSQVGQILLTLRWRASWWEVLGDGRINDKNNIDQNASPSSSDSESQRISLGHERYEYRVQNLCKILYAYYTSIRLKLPSWVGTDSVPDGVWSMYADAAPVWDDFPSVPTAEGFKSWMERGKDLIKEAGVKGRISKF